MNDGLKWWQIRDHQGYPLHPSPEQETLEKEMAEKAVVVPSADREGSNG